METITVLGIVFFIVLPLLMATVKMIGGNNNQADFPTYKPRVKK